ncbi:response regulator [Deinococcus yavapaiensis]|uniref:CheY-like chemotaxis protein n=1 Tax=Deinococcus yavapaiensis KR-236 TaxID=694435 RepID=A0A318RYZ1_9DEIO|nr:response regulator [Deinococcus yavapaiensis]PYE48688.1 CheY-like chemotaxis protein [Deinococcus yavapaiensis KR-236]
MSDPRVIDILLVEDNVTDVVLTREVFAEASVPNEVHVARDGVEALSFLRREGSYEESPTPDVILLDINMPRMSGLEFLATLKNDPQLRHIPVIMLTTSAAERDVERSYELHANAYITKPVDFGAFSIMMHTFEAFWLSIARLPSVSAKPAI